MVLHVYLILVLILAVLLDLGLIYWTRRNLERRGITADDERAVHLFNAYSPVLTWFSYTYRSILDIRKKSLKLPRFALNNWGNRPGSVNSKVIHQRENSLNDPRISAKEPARVHLRFQVSANERIQLTIEALSETGEAIFEQLGAQEVVLGTSIGGEIPASGQFEISSLPEAIRPAGKHWGTLSNQAAELARTVNTGLREHARSWLSSLGMIFFGLSLVVYLATRVIGLADFPIYFFSDEAVHTMLASDLVRDGFENYAGEFLPTFFDNAGTYRLGTTVYMHILPAILLENSVFVTRATSVLVTLAGAYALGLILRDFFKLRYWWSGVLFLSITPAWFLHSRTAFEYAMAVTFYVFFLYFYLRYRFDRPRYLYAALISGALAFYSYSPMQLVVVVSGVLLLISDFRYHLGLLRSAETRPTLLKGIGVLSLLALPYARFVWMHPDANYETMQALDSYWIKHIPPVEKLKLYFSEYLSGLNPLYWFFPNHQDLVRHQMNGYGHVLFAMLPFVIAAMLRLARKFRQSEYRLLLIALLAAPTGAALVELTVSRALVMVIPLVLLASLGVDLLLRTIESEHLTRTRLSVAMFAVLSLFNLSMLRDVLVNGPTWYQDYGMSGMQFGASQVFGAVHDVLEEDPGANIFITPEWSFSTDRVARFFLPDSAPVKFGSIRDFIDHYKPFTDLLFVVRAQDYESILTSDLFTDIAVKKIIPYPNQQPGFYFLTMRYKENAEAAFLALQEDFRELQQSVILLDGEPVRIKYSSLDIGEIGNIFDGEPMSLMRTRGANPAVIELTFAKARTISEIYFIFGNTGAEIKVAAYSSDTDVDYKSFSGFLSGTAQQPGGKFIFESPVLAKRIHIEVRDTAQGEPGHVHLWEVELR